jgi:hypothetical protein
VRTGTSRPKSSFVVAGGANDVHHAGAFQSAIKLEGAKPSSLIPYFAGLLPIGDPRCTPTKLTEVVTVRQVADFATAPKLHMH